MKIQTRLNRLRLHTEDNLLVGSGSTKEALPSLVVHFSQSKVDLEWDDRFESLLDLAEQHDIPISAGCRYGDCGTCQTQLLAGEIDYSHATGVRPDPGYCLPCSCRPLTSITLAT